MYTTILLYSIQNLYALCHLYIFNIINDASITHNVLPISHPNPPHSFGIVEATKVKKKPNPQKNKKNCFKYFL